jgi:hypothetical protein
MLETNALVLMVLVGLLGFASTVASLLIELAPNKHPDKDRKVHF